MTETIADTVTAPLPPVIRAAEEGLQRWWYGGGVMTWLATAEETGGAFFLFRDVMEKGKCTPLHKHDDADETMYLIDGEIVVHVDGKESTVSAGGVFVAPRGTAHAFLVTSETATAICFQTPGVCESFYLGGSEPLTPDVEQVVDFDRIRASGEANGGIEILGPPPFPAS